MSLVVDGIEVENVIYNGVELDNVVCDGVTVFQRIVDTDVILDSVVLEPKYVESYNANLIGGGSNINTGNKRVDTGNQIMLQLKDYIKFSNVEITYFYTNYVNYGEAYVTLNGNGLNRVGFYGTTIKETKSVDKFNQITARCVAQSKSSNSTWHAIANFKLLSVRLLK